MKTQRRFLDIHWVREQFPALDYPFIFMDNAGGSQITGKSIQYIQDYFHRMNVQLGATYHASAEAGKQMERTHSRIGQLLNAGDSGQIVIGPSTTMLLRILSICISKLWKPGDEVIVSHADHEANISCWKDLHPLGIQIKIWHPNPETHQLEIDDLKKLLTERTRLVAMVHVSNVIGSIHPVSEIAKWVHEAGALLCVDGVAFTPHRIPDLQALDVDFYVFSTYKTFGPHQAIMYGKKSLLDHMPGINHFFIQSTPYKFQPGNFNFELTYSMNGFLDYYDDLYHHHFHGHPTDILSRNHQINQLISRYEEKLAAPLLEFLQSRRDIRVIGSSNVSGDVRVPTVSFVHESLSSEQIVTGTEPYRIGIRYGDFYAHHLINELGLRNQSGVVRVSMVHYNAIEEVLLLIKALDEILFSS
ncbi:MAG TPA: aminotransferase class V-fold PLP-dependent enzyme [Saprospiraceae bacterium]|nr:aminotransferase class V-fold PLP-dependent enzyme [Saprospiraceae bacterium]